MQGVLLLVWQRGWLVFIRFLFPLVAALCLSCQGGGKVLLCPDGVP